MIGQDTQFQHSLVPLVLAVSLVRAKISADAPNTPPDADGLATFIASAVPIFEYFEDPNWYPRWLGRAWQDGVFRQGGAELRFIDGRRSKRLLAVQAHDVECVIDMLNHPDHARLIRARVLICASTKAKRNSQTTRKEAATLRADARQARSNAVLQRGSTDTPWSAAIWSTFRNAHAH